MPHDRPGDPADILLDTLIDGDRWATRLLIERCVSLPQADFERRLEIGHGSLHDTVDHLIRATRFFTARLEGVPPHRPVQTAHRTADAMLDEFDAAHGALVAALERTRSLPMGAPIELPAGPGGEAPVAVTRADWLAQITTHGAYHRAQIANMLRQLGVDPIPKTDLVLRAIERSRPATRDSNTLTSHRPTPPPAHSSSASMPRPGAVT